MMLQQTRTRDIADELLADIVLGMPVFDLTGEKVGTVSHIQNANLTGVEPVMVRDSHVKDAPDFIRLRLINTGYIRIKGGLLSPTYYACAEQIASVMADSVQLYAMREELWTL
jgi:hypothetical protein